MQCPVIPSISTMPQWVNCHGSWRHCECEVVYKRQKVSTSYNGFLYIGTPANAHALQSHTHGKYHLRNVAHRVSSFGEKGVSYLGAHANCSNHLRHKTKATEQLQRAATKYNTQNLLHSSSTLVAPALKRSVAFGCSPMERLDHSC